MMTTRDAVPQSRLPGTLLEIRRLFDTLDWQGMARQVEQETQARVAIVGPVNSGKSTLFNTLKGRDVSPVAAVPGTTRELHSEQWGPFTLTDTPGFGEVDGVNRASIALQGVDAADVIVLILDAIAGVREADYALLQQLRRTGKPVVVALNKMDLLKEERDAVVAHARDKLGEPELIPISAKRGTHVAEILVPQVLEAHPSLAVALGRALPAYRRQAANRVIRNASLFNTAIGAGPVPGLDIPFLLATQARMVLRIAAIFGETMSAQHAKELVATIAGGVTLRYLAQAGVKFVPALGWAVSATVAGVGTWAMGQVARQYFEHGKTLSARELQDRYQSLVRRRRRGWNQDRAPRSRREKKTGRRRRGDWQGAAQ
jgi:small GTP-binding protein